MTRKLLLSLAFLLAATLAAGTPKYLVPPAEVVAAFDAPPLPDALLSPSKKVMALSYRKGQPTIAALSQPMLRLAGARVNPRTNGPHRTALIYAIKLQKIGGGAPTNVTVPANANLSNVKFSADGSKLAFLNTQRRHRAVGCECGYRRREESQRHGAIERGRGRSMRLAGRQSHARLQDRSPRARSGSGRFECAVRSERAGKRKEDRAERDVRGHDPHGAR
jgi:hypothetical protein